MLNALGNGIILKALADANDALLKAHASEEVKELSADQIVFSVSENAVALHTNDQALELCREMDKTLKVTRLEMVNQSLEESLTKTLSEKLQENSHRYILMLPTQDIYLVFTANLTTLQANLEKVKHLKVGRPYLMSTLPKIMREPPIKGRKHTPAEIEELVTGVTDACAEALKALSEEFTKRKAHKTHTICVFAMLPPEPWDVGALTDDELLDIAAGIDKDIGRSDGVLATVKNVLKETPSDDFIRIAVYVPSHHVFVVGYMTTDAFGSSDERPKVFVSPTFGKNIPPEKIN